MWIVMTASAHMPQSCKGRYRKIALVELKSSWDARPYNQPKAIDSRNSKIARIIQMGNHSVGKTERCAYARVLKEAERRASELNNAPTPEAGAELAARAPAPDSSPSTCSPFNVASIKG